MKTRGTTRLIDTAQLGAHLDSTLIFKFFAAFSRFEYALKKAGFRIGTAAKVAADWEAFAREIDAQFSEMYGSDAQFRAAVDWLVAQPPKKQRDDLTWLKVDPQGVPTGALNMTLIVGRIRNNLFHVGKGNALRRTVSATTSLSDDPS